jgi:hypothetical protein
MVAGAFERTAELGGAALTSAGSFDGFLLRLRGADGAPVWSRDVAAGAYRDVAYGVAVAAPDDVYVVGRYFGSAKIAGQAVKSAGDWDAFIADYDLDGNVKWMRHGGGPGDDYFRAVATLSTGDAVVAGSFAKKTGWTVTFDDVSIPGTDGETWDAVVARYGRDGQIAWAKPGMSEGQNTATAIVNDGSDGVLIGGKVQGGTWFGASFDRYTSSALARLTSAGGVTWAVPLVTVSNPPAGYTYLPDTMALAAGPGAVVLGGEFSGTVTYQGASNHTDYDWTPMAGYVATLGGAGAKRGFAPFLATDDSHIDAVATAANGDVLAAVSYSGTLALGDGPVTSQGGTDIAIVRLPAPTQPAAAVTPPAAQPPGHGPTSACAPPAALGPAPPVGPDPTFETNAVALSWTPRQFSESTALRLGANGRDLIVGHTNCARCGPTDGYGGPLLALAAQGGTLVDDTATLLPGPVDFWSFANAPPKAVDLNGDGRDDVFFAQHSYDSFPWYGDLAVALVQQPDGTLRDESPDRVPIDPRAIDPTFAAFTHFWDIADIDCAGHPSAFLVNDWSAFYTESRLLVNDGHGRLFDDQRGRLPAAMFADNPQPGWFESVVFCDVNRDGAPDLVLGANTDSHGVDTLLLNDGFGSFTESPGAVPAPPDLGGDERIINLLCVDVNHDGWNDIVYLAHRNYTTFRTGIWLNRGDGTFVAAADTALPEPARSSYGHPMYAIDLNGDGWPDLVGAGGRVFAAVNNGDGTFHDLTSIFPAVTSFNYGVVPLDVDGDGKTDLFLDYSDTPTAYVLRNTSP